jgi:pyruvate/2-oxoglutarate dehydrogenase complex dihydrolipoamide acyltransferase (E2) component
MSKEIPKFPSRLPASATARQPAATPADPAPKATSQPAGRVKFDDRGNAVYEWSVATGEFGRDSATARLKKLDNPSLSLADDAPTPVEVARANPLGTLKGYNPYDSGKLGTKEVPKKKDLKKLSEWLALRKQAAENKQDDE